jgi:uncharacterized protein (DUF342 family)
MEENRLPGQPEDVLNTQGTEEDNGPKKPAIVLKVSPNLMELEMELLRTGTNTLPPAYDDVMKAIADAGVVYGINEERIRSLCASPRFNSPTIVARGKPEETGADGYIDYKIETVKDMKPKIRSDGTVDYRDLGLVQNVAAGQLLCEIHAAQKGADGANVYGAVLEGRYGKAPVNVVGNNTALNEDETQLLSLVDGNVEVRKGAVHVNTQLMISGNVDNSTGDLDFVGDILIKGDVRSGFKVVSAGNITVRGTVEGATLEATGDVTVNEGINGMNRGSIIAGGHIKCKYIQSCFMRAGQAIYADSIMYCTIECDGNVELSGKRGVLIGGTATISGGLIAKALGTDSHTATHIIMKNEDKKLTEERLQLEKRLQECAAEELKITQVINRVRDAVRRSGHTTPELNATLTAAANTMKSTRAEHMKAQIRLEEVKQEQLRQSRENNCYIECKDRVHSGVQLAFGPLNMHVQQSFVFCRISLIEDDIVVTPLSPGGR